MGATKDGKFVAGFAELKYQAGAFQGSPVQPGMMCAYAPYDIENVHVIGYDVVSNRPKVAAYRAPARRSPSTRSRAWWTRSPRSSASTRSSCA